jgi:S1-C subfamily serine protease
MPVRTIIPTCLFVLLAAVLPAAAQPAPGSPAGVGQPVSMAPPVRAALGIGLQAQGPDDAAVKVEGAVVARLMPGGPAEQAGLAIGDVLLAVNGEALAADDAAAANRRLIRFMDSVNPGEELTLRYRRGTAQPAVVRIVALAAPAPGAMQMAMAGHCPMHRAGAHGPRGHRGAAGQGGQALAGLRLADLTPELGRYFGADSGVLVLRAPGDGAFGLEDGDVIRTIGGRTPMDQRHARRILASYAAGETVTIGVLRDRKARDLEARLPGSPAGAK